MAGKPLKVLIEASEAYRNNTGVGRFSRELIRHLPPDLDLAYSPPDYAVRQHTTGVRTLRQRILHFAQHVSLTQWRVMQVARRTQSSLVHSLNFFVPLLARRTPAVATIFDLAYFDLPQETDRFWGLYGRRMMPVFAARAAAVITTSNVSREKIIARFRLTPEKVHCVYAGVDARFRPVEDAARRQQVKDRYGLPETFVLYTGAWRATKNLSTLLRALQGLDMAAVLTGAPHTAQQRALPERAQALGVDARFIGHVPDKDLPTLYSLAKLYVLPSLYEGFGLPVVEAMACGTPAVVSDIPVLCEVTGGAAPTFPPDAPDALRETLLRLMRSETEYMLWRERALQRARFFDWRETARRVVSIWQQLHAQTFTNTPGPA